MTSQREDRATIVAGGNHPGSGNLSTVRLKPLPFWRHDLTSCLQDCLASVLLFHGEDPVVALGAAWDFFYPQGDYRREEYYFPMRAPGLVESVLPYHPAKSEWHTPANPYAGWRRLREEIADGHPALVAVDNFYLAFRPAWGDVHTNHLVVAYGFDETKRVVYVLDSKPPRFCGPVSFDDFQAARYSLNPSVHDRDLFYQQQPIEGRWLDVRLEKPFPEFNLEWVRDVVRRNVARFVGDPTPQRYQGLGGLESYLADCVESASRGASPFAMDELYVVGWAMQQMTALHADFLNEAGRRFGVTRLSEIGRDVDRLAHHWTDLRMLAAHHRGLPGAVADRLHTRSRMLVGDTTNVLERLETVAA